MNTHSDHRENESTELEPTLAAAVNSILTEQIPADALQRIKNRAIALAPEASMQDEPQVETLSRPQLSHPKLIRSKLNWLVRSGLAASVLAVCVVVVSLMGKSRGAFAQIIDQIQQIQTASFFMESKGGIAPDIAGWVTVQRPNLMRIDFVSETPRVNVTDTGTGELISFDMKTGPVIVHEVPAEPRFDVLRQLISAEGRWTLKEELETEDGVDCYSNEEGFLTVWIQRDTQLPVRVEAVAPMEMGGQTVVFSDFQWNVDIDAGLFAIPADREVRRNTLFAEETEQDMIEAFRVLYAFSDEPLSADFFGENVGLTLGQLAYDRNKSRAENQMIQASAFGKNPERIGMLASDLVDPTAIGRRIDELCMKLDRWQHRIERNGGWIGGSVKPGEDKPILWYRNQHGEIRVLSGDLTFSTTVEPPRNSGQR